MAINGYLQHTVHGEKQARTTRLKAQQEAEAYTIQPATTVPTPHDVSNTSEAGSNLTALRADDDSASMMPNNTVHHPMYERTRY